VIRSSSEGVPRPEEFPIGSAESRAAARALLDARDRGVRRIKLVLNMDQRPPRERDDGKGAVGPWTVGLDGNLWRTILLPRGADDKTKRLILAMP
jgi:hypothetical protein